MMLTTKEKADRLMKSIRARAEQLIVRHRDEKWRNAPNYSAELQLVIGLLRNKSKGGKDGWKLAKRAGLCGENLKPDPLIPMLESYKEPVD